VEPVKHVKRKQSALKFAGKMYDSAKHVCGRGELDEMSIDVLLADWAGKKGWTEQEHQSVRATIRLAHEAIKRGQTKKQFLKSLFN
jgi:hypothetical protein